MEAEYDSAVRNRPVLLLAVAGLLSGVLGISPAAAAAATPRDSVHTFLTGAAALSPSDAWTVGWGGIGTSTANSESLHWNGKQWVSVPTASEGNVNGLEGVSATGPSDVWAVGWLVSNCLIEHFNGQKWSNVPCPYHGVISQLNAVNARTTSDVWAVGYIDPVSNQIAFADHWNGKQWTPVSTAPVSGSFIQFNSVLDLGPSNVLAVGYYETKSGTKYVRHQLAEHWNGHAWLRVGLPQFSTASFLMGASGGNGRGVIAVGGVSAGSHDVPLIERWTGTQFVRVTEPVSSGDLSSVTVLSSTDAYAAGETGSGATLVEHYNGKQWAQVSTPNPSGGGYFNSVAATPSGSFAVAVGWHAPYPNELPLIEQGNGHTWHITRQLTHVWPGTLWVPGHFAI
jgi:hypothetical protein